MSRTHRGGPAAAAGQLGSDQAAVQRRSPGRGVRVARVLAQLRAEAWPLTVLSVAFLVGFLGIRSKLRLLSPRWSSIARWLGLNDATNLTAVQRLDFLSSDVALALLVLPAIGFLLLGRLPRRWRLACAVILCTPLVALTYLHTVSRQVIGEYLSWNLVREALEWGTRNPDTITEYLSPSTLWRLGGLVALAVVVLTTGDRMSKEKGPLGTGAFSRFPITIAILGVGTAATVLCMLATRVSLDVHRTPLHESALWAMTKSLLSENGKTYRPRAGASYLDDTRAFRRMTKLDSPSSGMPLVGSMRRANVVVFVVETGPAAVLDLTGDAAAWRGFSRLIGRSLVTDDHLTTYPYTSDAVFSILSGLYPGGRRQLVRHWSAGETPGLFTELRGEGYSTAVFAPSIFTRELDETMYRAFGIEEIHNVATNPDEESMPLAPSYVEQSELWRDRGAADDVDFDKKLRADAKALAELLSFIEDRHEAGQPFAALYLPQASHAPWHGRGEVRERGLLQMELQVIGLNDIVEKLSALGDLDDTIIVFTADHGIRTKIEDPSLNTGFATPYMFQTPLMVFAPRALSESVRIAAPTSHVDIAPTVLALLGHPRAHDIGVGIPIWQATSDRRVYFLADGYGGFNGFVENGEYFQLQVMTDQAYGPSAAMEFDPTSESVSGSPDADRVRRTLEEYESRQSRLIGGLMAPSKPISAGVGALSLGSP